MPSATISQANRPLAIQTPLGDDVLGLRRILVQERLGRPFAIEADMSSEDPDINFDDLVGHPVTVRLNLPSGERRYWHAFVARFQMVGMTQKYYDYRASLVPWIWVMSRGADFRIFQKENVPDIVQKVLRERGAKDFEARLSWEYEPWEYCVQYRETDLNFVSRLLEQEGITYYHQHDENKGMLVLADDKSAYDPVPGYEEIPFRPSAGSDPQQEAIRSWIIEHELQPTQYAVADYNPLIPSTELQQRALTPRGYGVADRQIFDYPGEYETPAQGEIVARIRLEELQTGWQTLRAESNCLGLYAGCLFGLIDHPRAEQNRQHLITAMQLQFDGGDFDADNLAPRAHCSFTAIPHEIPYRPPRSTPKPVVQGPQCAVVVGPTGEEIHTDEHARVKVHFFWDREGKADETSSCWIRVSQSNAGKGWGSMITPRIGQEVIVEFLEGDPDRPIITGRVYNAEQKPPYAGGQGVVSGLKSNTHKGGGYNEMSLDDTAGKEKITIHAQYDMGTTVEHDDTQTVHNDRTISVDGKHTETIKKNTTIHITEGDLEQKVITGKADYTVEKTQTTTVKLQIKDESTDADILQVAKDNIRFDSGAGKSTGELRPNGEIELSSAEQIKFITGESSITLKKDGTILISGKKITVSGTDEASMGVGNQSVTCDKQQVATSGAAISSSAVGKHEISGAVVKLN